MQKKRRSSSAVDRLPLYVFGDASSRHAGCAYAAISLLTGEDPFQLRKIYRDRAGMSPAKITKHLRNCGFLIKSIDTAHVYKLLGMGVYITDYHVILAAVRMTSQEATWVVLYGGQMWHNFVPTSTSYASSLSFPLEHAYMLYLPTWAPTKTSMREFSLSKIPQ